MHGFDYDFTDRMHTGKAAADARRARGLHTGKTAAGWNYKRREPDSGTHEHSAAIVRAAWECARGDAIEGYRFACYGEQWGDL